MIITSSHGNVNMILKFVGIIYTLRTVWEKCKDRKLWRWRLRFISDIIHNRKYTTDDYWKNINRRGNNSYGIKSGTSSREKNVWLQLCAGSGVHVLWSGGNWHCRGKMLLSFLRDARWLLFCIAMRKCRNWQTSKIQVLVSVTLVRVQVPSSASDEHSEISGCSFWFLGTYRKTEAARDWLLPFFAT